jgi:hypothetical protein
VLSFLYFFLVVWFVIFSTNDFNFILFLFCGENNIKNLCMIIMRGTLNSDDGISLVLS